MSGWEDLSGAELRARLVQRGLSKEDADRAVEYRDRPKIAEWITRVLNG